MDSFSSIQELLPLWGMEGEKLTLAPDSAGLARKTNVWFVGKEAVLKCAGDAEQLRRSFSLARLLEARGLEAATVIPATDGSELVFRNGMWYAMMKRLSGRHLRSQELYGPGGEERAFRIGEAIGGLSLALRSFDALVAESDFGRTIFEWALPRAREWVSLPDSFCSRYIARLEQLLPLLPRQIIHRDPNLGNILFSGGRCGFLDFDLAERSIRVFDPVYAAGSILGETFDEEKTHGFARWRRIWQSVLCGFDAVAGLTPEEREAAPCVLVGIECIFTAWCAEQPSGKGLFEVSAAMLRLFCEDFDGLRI